MVDVVERGDQVLVREKLERLLVPAAEAAGMTTRVEPDPKDHGLRCILWVTTDLNFHIEVVFDFSIFFLISLAPGINRILIVYIFSIHN
jgi:hypothetical protein